MLGAKVDSELIFLDKMNSRDIRNALYTPLHRSVEYVRMKVYE